MSARPALRRHLCLAAVLAVAAAALVGPPPAVAQVTSVDQLVYPPLPRFDIPTPRRETLPNGMVVVLLPDHELPLVEALALVRTGSRLEPADQLGLAELTGEVLRTGGIAAAPGADAGGAGPAGSATPGRGAMSADDLDDFLEGKAASIETSIDTEVGQASMSCLAADLPEVLRVFAAVLRRPAFAEDRLEVARTGSFASIARQNDNPQGVLFRELGELIYGEDSPYARSPTFETIGGIGRDDLVAWHARWFHPERIELGLVGDFDPDRALALVREAFGDWPRGAGGADPEAAYRSEPRPGVFFVEKNDMTQAAIALGHLGIRKDAPDFHAVEVLNDLLSGSFSSRLVADIRTARGLAYAVSGSVGSDFDHPGTTVLWMTTKTETAGAGVAALLDEARGLTRRPPTAEEVERSRAAILNSFIFKFDSPGKILLQQLYYQHFGYPLDRMERYRQGIEKVTVEEVRRAAAEEIHPDRFAILVVGPAAARQQLTQFGEIHDLDVTIPEPAATAE